LKAAPWSGVPNVFRSGAIDRIGGPARGAEPIWNWCPRYGWQSFYKIDLALFYRNLEKMLSEGMFYNWKAQDMSECLASKGLNEYAN
jgi:hypothetical protein